eukprot:m.81336 g.81336  ORF g.81336 m.81336 type:complete len:1305 (+) comp9405_c0_seq1:200-4114(+)
MSVAVEDMAAMDDFDVLTTEDVIRMIRTEGRTARNIVSWSVPPEEPEEPAEAVDSDDEFTTVTSSRRKRGSSSNSPPTKTSTGTGEGTGAGNNTAGHTRKHRTSRRGHGSAPSKHPTQRGTHADASGRGGVNLTRQKLTRSGSSDFTTSSPTRNRKETAQSQLWRYLLSSLIRATDEVYEICEAEENKLQCQEVITLMETALADFKELISRFELHSKFEQTATSGSKPEPLAWSVRKISPIHSVRVANGSPTRTARGGSSTSPTRVNVAPKGQKLSYADRVKGRRFSRRTSAPGSAGDDGGTGTNDIPSDPEDPEEMMDGLGGGERLNPHASPKTPERRSHRVPGSSGDDGVGSADDSAAIEDEERHERETEEETEEKGGSGGDGGLGGVYGKDTLYGVGSGDEAATGMDDGERPVADLVTPTGSPHRVGGGAAHSSPVAMRWSDLANDDGWSSDSDTGADMAVSSPGSTVLLHTRLSSPSRKRTTAESRRIYEEKQARASEKRERQQQELAERLRRENSKLEAARERREMEEFRKVEDMILKRQRAEELRGSHLEVVRKKAHEEDQKINEIVFITRLQEENRKREISDKLNESQERLQELEDERLRKAQEKAAREGAAAERRKALEAERTARLQGQEAKRLAREEKIAEDKKRSAAEREKAAAQRQQVAKRREELTRPQHMERRDQDSTQTERLRKGGGSGATKGGKGGAVSSTDSSPRIKVKKSALGGGGTAPPSGRGHADSGSGATVGLRVPDVLLPAAVQPPPSRDRNEKSIKKRIKRIRQRMAHCVLTPLVPAATHHNDNATATAPAAAAPSSTTFLSIDFDANDVAPALAAVSPHVARHLRRLHAWHKSAAASKGASSLDVSMFDNIMGALHKCVRDKTVKLTSVDCAVLSRAIIDCCVTFQSRGGVPPGTEGTQHPPAARLSLRSSAAALRVVQDTLMDHRSEGVLAVLGTGEYLLKLVDAFVVAVPGVYAAPHDASIVPADPEAGAAAAKVMAQAVFALVDNDSKANLPVTCQQAIDDVCMYGNAVGMFDIITQLMYRVPRQALEASVCVAAVVEDCLDLLLLFCSFNPAKRRPAQTEFLDMIHSSHLTGIVSPLMCQLLLQRRTDVEQPPGYDASSILLLGLKILNRLSVLDLTALQTTLSEDWLSTSLCHVLVRLLTQYCDADTRQAVAMLHETIYLVGKFTETNPRGRQLLVDGGGFATILPILCKLPFRYFSEDTHMEILFPTLLSICHGSDENAAILQRELSLSTMVDYIDRKIATGTQTSDDRFSCCNRFPSAELEAARSFFVHLSGTAM